MQQREITDCGKCGLQVEIVPAGVSKKTNKPYGAFYKCKNCGFGKSMTPTGAVKPPAGEYKDTDGEILAKLTRIEKGIEEIYKVVSKKDFNES